MDAHYFTAPALFWSLWVCYSSLMVSLSVLSVSSSCFPSDVVHSCFIPCFIYLSCYFLVYFLITTFLLCFVQSFTGGLCPFLNHRLCVHRPLFYPVGSVYLFWFALYILLKCLTCFILFLDLGLILQLNKKLFFPALEFLIL